MVENELQFVGWKEFRQMVPSIVQLEIARLSRVIASTRGQPDVCNTLVKARFELDTFIACLRYADKDALEVTCAPHLQAALLAISVLAAELDEADAATLRYIADRLSHVNDRMELIY